MALPEAGKIGQAHASNQTQALVYEYSAHGDLRAVLMLYFIPHSLELRVVLNWFQNYLCDRNSETDILLCTD
jgi:hypothetical protein